MNRRLLWMMAAVVIAAIWALTSSLPIQSTPFKDYAWAQAQQTHPLPLPRGGDNVRGSTPNPVASPQTPSADGSETLSLSKGGDLNRVAVHPPEADGSRGSSAHGDDRANGGSDEVSSLFSRAQADFDAKKSTSFYGAFKNIVQSEKIDLQKFYPQLNATDVKNITKRNDLILAELLKRSQSKFRLGLDLAGGVSFTFKVDVSKLTDNYLKTQALEKAKEILTQRVDGLGVAEPVVRIVGADSIEVQMPGLSLKENPQVADTLQAPAMLEFALVSRTAKPGVDETPLGYRLMTEEDEDPQSGQTITRSYFVKKMPELTGSAIAQAYPATSDTGSYRVALRFTPEGGKRFADVTQRIADENTKTNTLGQLAIILDGKLYSAPSVREAILGGNAEISGHFNQREAIDLANVLNNPLEVGLKMDSMVEVGPTLADQARDTSLMACVIGCGVVAFFMIGYYGWLGTIAMVGVTFTLCLILGTMAGIGSTFSLPGISALVLTVGMAVDSNILIFERMREELKNGRTLHLAHEVGHARAFATIFDANLVTLLTSLLMVWFGAGPVKGFGVILSIGIVSTLFSTLILCRMLQEIVIAIFYKGGHSTHPQPLPQGGENNNRGSTPNPAATQGWGSILSLLGFGGNRPQGSQGAAPKISPSLGRGQGVGLKALPHNWFQIRNVNFMSAAGIAFTLSWALIVFGLFAFVTHQDKVWGIDFKGGEELMVNFTQKLSPLDIAKATKGISEVNPIYQSVMGTGSESLRLQTSLGKGQQVLKTLQAAYPKADLKLISTTTIGASVGHEVQRGAIIAVIAALVGILIYIAFRFEIGYAVGALIATIHDLLMTIGVYVLLGQQFSSPMIAALLLVIGYSINDTVVVFDRIREELKLNPHLSLLQVINLSVNVTLSRTILTSFTAFLATTALYIFGAGVVREYALVFLIGIVTGTYSSIFIASPIFYWWHKGNRRDVEEKADPIKKAYSTEGV